MKVKVSPLEQRLTQYQLDRLRDSHVYRKGVRYCISCPQIATFRASFKKVGYSLLEYYCDLHIKRIEDTHKVIKHEEKIVFETNYYMQRAQINTTYYHKQKNHRPKNEIQVKAR
jgi:hypothetical protein